MEHADRVTESVRAINHLSRLAGSVPEPATIYPVITHMERAAHRLPQALGQLDRRLTDLAAVPDVVGLSGDPEERPLNDSHAGEHANALARALQSAAQCLGRPSLAPGGSDRRGVMS